MNWRKFMDIKIDMTPTSLEAKNEEGRKRQRELQQNRRKRLVRRRKKQLLCILGVVIIVCIIIRCSTKSSKPEPTPTPPTAGSDTDATNTESPVDTDTTPSILDSFSIDDWNLVLINEYSLLTSEAEFDSAYLDNGLQVDARIYDELVQMLDDGTQMGLSFIVCSAYRTISYQEELFNDQVATLQNEGMTPEEAYLAAKTSVAVPGASEHHLGLAVDIIADSYRILDEQQANTPEYQWLMKNCYKYGFIVRYPEGRSDITGFIYEPWHFRYVGVDAATYITEHNLSLEEFLDLI